MSDKKGTLNLGSKPTQAKMNETSLGKRRRE